MRKILHIDMDAFYAAIEQRDDPSLRGRPVAVGGSSDRGVVMTASYEARPFGIRSAMPSALARRLCPDLVFVRPRFDAYKAASAEIREVFGRFTTLIEPLSLDEAYLDVTRPRIASPSAVAIAREIKAQIRERTGLTASAGVSFNKFLAKIASDLDKPDGLVVIRPKNARRVIAELPIERFHGIGPATARRLRGRGISCGADLQSLNETQLVAAFGSAGRYYYRLAQAIDDRPVSAERERKSLSVERTLEHNLTSLVAFAPVLEALADELAARLERSSFQARSLTLKIKLADFRILTRRTTRLRPFVSREDILRTAISLLDRDPPPKPVRLLGLGVSRDGRDKDRRQLMFDLGSSPASEPATLKVPDRHPDQG